MLSFIVLIFNNIFRRRPNDALPPPPGASGAEDIRLWADDEPPEAHDTSYDDAWFDAQARRVAQSEFAGVLPPPDAYKKVLLAIEVSTVPERKPVLKPGTASLSLPGLVAALYRILSAPATARILPSGVALLIALAVVGPELRQMLSS